MTHSIVKFKSGFYGLKVLSTGEFYRADLIPWDGKRGTSYPVDLNTSFEHYIDSENTVYYSDIGGADARVWCGWKRLNAHCQHLAAIKARR